MDQHPKFVARANPGFVARAREVSYPGIVARAREVSYPGIVARAREVSRSYAGCMAGWAEGAQGHAPSALQLDPCTAPKSIKEQAVCQPSNNFP